jgi:hypothetical protein
VKVIRPTNGEKSEEILCFEVLDVLFVAWTSFMEAYG